MAIFSRDYGIDLGTTSVLVSTKNKGVILKSQALLLWTRLTAVF